MSAGEIDRERIKEATQERTQRLAGEAGQSAIAAAQEFLDRHADLIDHDAAAMIKDREFATAYKDVETGRQEGRLNDECSEAPGLTLFLTGDAVARLRERAVERTEEAPYLAGYVTAIEPVDPDGTVHSLRLPMGEYAVPSGMGAIQIHGIVVPERSPSLHHPILLGLEEVVRVEGDSGEVWQSPWLMPNGTPRPE